MNRQVQAWASRCDDITHGIIQLAASKDGFALGASDRGKGEVDTDLLTLMFLDIVQRCAYETDAAPGWLALVADAPVPLRM